MDWTNGPDQWTIGLLDYILDCVLDHSLDHFLDLPLSKIYREGWVFIVLHL